VTLFEIIVFNQTISMIINNALYEWNHFFFTLPKMEEKSEQQAPNQFFGNFY
jgi:hypothetical protein